tara:strand:+ start:628 stop:900 length:273 start_codon:yes stop_codon:yes gene_type:complete
MSAYEQLKNNQRQLDAEGIEVGVSRQALDQLLTTAVNTSAIIQGIYEWVDLVEAEGGLTNISGVARGHAMMESLKKNRPRVNEIAKGLLK